MGHPFVRTPSLDRLAGDGVNFVEAFCTTPLCSPARASVLTGLYAYAHGVRDHGTHARWDDDRATFLQLLQREAGYATAFIGKWHMPGSGPPRLRGVDRFVTFTIEGGQGRYLDCPLIVDGRETESRTPYLGTELTDRALEFVRETGGGPFCLYLSHKAVHHPWVPPADLEGIYAQAPVTLPPGANSWSGFTDGQIWGGVTRPLASAYRSYMETVTGMDREIGRLLDGLDALGVGDECLVVYSSDNGFLFGEHGRVELRWPLEEVLRVPLLVRAPRAMRQAPRRLRHMALNIDLAPTFLDVAGVVPPHAMHGRSLLSLLQGEPRWRRRAWLVEYYRDFPYRTPSYQGVRTERYLYVEYEGDFPPTLHDLFADPGQTADLMGSPQAARAVPELRRLLQGLRQGERFDA